MTTTIEYCEGIHEATGMQTCSLREIRTELPEDYFECPEAEQQAVLASLHRLEVARVEVASRINRTGRDGNAEVEVVMDAHSDELLDAGCEDASTFVATYNEVADEIEGLR